MEDIHPNQMKPIQFITPIKGRPGPEWRDNETTVRSHALKYHIWKQHHPSLVYNGRTETDSAPKGLAHYTGRYRLNPTQKSDTQTKQRNKKWQKQHAIDANV